MVIGAGGDGNLSLTPVYFLHGLSRKSLVDISLRDGGFGQQQNALRGDIQSVGCKKRDAKFLLKPVFDIVHGVIKGRVHRQASRFINCNEFIVLQKDAPAQLAGPRVGFRSRVQSNDVLRVDLNITLLASSIQVNATLAQPTRGQCGTSAQLQFVNLQMSQQVEQGRTFIRSKEANSRFVRRFDVHYLLSPQFESHALAAGLLNIHAQLAPTGNVGQTSAQAIRDQTRKFLAGDIDHGQKQAVRIRKTVFFVVKPDLNLTVLPRDSQIRRVFR
jgi:hypothetical protein